MSVGTNLEIERKYLIRYPDVALLKRQSGCEVWEIVQTYLVDGPEKQTRRVRRIDSDGRTRLFRTFKKHVSALSSVEDEAEITPDEYQSLLQEADRTRMPVRKTRCRVPHGGHTVEIDIYPFWQDRAIMEIELKSEDEAAEIPEYIRVIREVTGEKAYKNRQLAKRVPMEPID